MPSPTADRVKKHRDALRAAGVLLCRSGCLIPGSPASPPSAPVRAL